MYLSPDRSPSPRIELAPLVGVLMALCAVLLGGVRNERTLDLDIGHRGCGLGRLSHGEWLDITVTSAGAVRTAQAEYTMEGFARQLEGIPPAARADTYIDLQVDDEATYDHVAQLMAAARSAGFSSSQILL